MRPIVTNVTRAVVCVCVCRAKTAELIELWFGRRLV